MTDEICSCHPFREQNGRDECCVDCGLPILPTPKQLSSERVINDTIQKCLTIIGEHIKGGHNNKSLVGKLQRAGRHGTIVPTVLKFHHELSVSIKQIATELTKGGKDEIE